jgi:hypothetical protein
MISDWRFRRNPETRRGQFICNWMKTRDLAYPTEGLLSNQELHLCRLFTCPIFIFPHHACCSRTHPRQAWYHPRLWQRAYRRKCPVLCRPRRCVASGRAGCGSDKRKSVANGSERRRVASRHDRQKSGCGFAGGLHPQILEPLFTDALRPSINCFLLKQCVATYNSIG